MSVEGSGLAVNSRVCECQVGYQ